MLPSSSHRARFGIFELNLKTRELRSNGQTVLLQEQPYRVLLLLLERGSNGATREDIQNTLWPDDTIVDFERGINTVVKNLRRMLNDSPDKPRYIETLPRLGYRMVVPVEWVASAIPATDGGSSEGNEAFGSHSAVLQVRRTDPQSSHPRLIEEPGGAEPPLRTNRHLFPKIVVPLVAIGIAAFVLFRWLSTDRRPQAARLDGSTLIVTNAKGEELWRKSFTDGFWADYYRFGLATRMWFGDLSGKEHTDVLLLYHPAVSPPAHSTTLICYSDRGREKWRWAPGRPLPDIEGDPGIFRIEAFGILKPAPGEHASRIVVASDHLLFHPHQTAILNSDGKLVSEYWHAGHLDHLTLADVDGDGREEIISAGVNNGYDQATLIVLDPDRVSGASIEATGSEFQIHGMGDAQEKVRLLFPRSDLNKALKVYNWAGEVTVLHGRIRLPVEECAQVPRCVIHYEFDSNFRLLGAIADDQFRSAHSEFYLRNNPHHDFDAKEEAEFQKVRCLVGCKTEFVPVQNH